MRALNRQQPLQEFMCMPNRAVDRPMNVKSAYQLTQSVLFLFFGTIEFVPIETAGSIVRRFVCDETHEATVNCTKVQASSQRLLRKSFFDS